MPTIFEVTDRDGDRLRVSKPSASDNELVVFARHTDDAVARMVVIDRADVDRLRAALAPYGTQPETTRATSAMVFDASDQDGDTLTVYRMASSGSRMAVAATVNAETNYEQTAHLTPGDVTRLRAALAEFDPTASAPTFRAGDHATVTGDSGQWGHPFDPGTRVTLVRESDNYGGIRGGRGGWACEAADGVEWCVHTSDLAPLPGDDTDAVPAQLDPRRVAALEKAAEIAAENWEESDHAEVTAFAAFLLGEA